MIFSTHRLHPEVEAALCDLGKYQVASAPTPAAIENESSGSEIIVVRAPIPAGVIARETQLRALVRHGAGLDMIPVDTATKAGVIVANVPGVNAVTVAEHIIWSAIALLRKYPQVRADLAESGWEQARRHGDNGQDLSGKSLGIVGLGNVGRALLNIAAGGFGMKVRTFVRNPDNLPKDVEYAPLDELLRASDIVALCCPLTEKTRSLIGEKNIGLMKSSAILINVARGPVVQQAALIQALKSNQIAGAALDVFDTQPLPHDHPFLKIPNVILTPHMAGITQESMLRMGTGVVDEVRRILSGQQPINFVNPTCLTHYWSRFGPLV